MVPWVFIVFSFIRILERKREKEATPSMELVMQYRRDDRPEYSINDARSILRQFFKWFLKFFTAVGFFVGFSLLTFGLLWLVELAWDATSWTWRIIYGAIPVLIVGSIACLIIVLVFTRLRLIMSDSYLWLRLQWPREPLSRPWIAERYKQFKSDFWRARFVAELRSIKVDDKDWPLGPPYTDDTPAAAELARLDERWRGLDR